MASARTTTKTPPRASEKPASKKPASKKPASKKPAPKKPAPKKPAPKKPTKKPVVVVGGLAEWPVGKLFAELLALPKWTLDVGCFLALGSHAKAVSERVFQKKETIGAKLAPYAETLLAGIELVDPDSSREEERSLRSQSGFHANMTAAELRAWLAKDYEVLSPAEALAASKAPAAKTLEKITTAAREAYWVRPTAVLRKPLAAYLAGGPIEPLLAANAHDLSRIFVTPPERFNEVDDRLFALWARVAHVGDALPGVSAAELGADRFSAMRAKLTAVGLTDDEAVRAIFGYAVGARWWVSTGLFVWKLLRDDPAKLARYLAPLRHRDRNLAHLLLSVTWLPEEVRERGALDAVLEACASKKLVSDEAFRELFESADDDVQPALASCRSLAPSTKAQGKKVAVKLGPAKRLLP